MFDPIVHSLKIKFSLAVVGILLIIFTLSSFYLINQSSEFQKNSLIARAETFANLATKSLGNAYSLYHNSGVLKLNDIFLQTLRLNNTVPRIQVISVGGEIMFDTNNIRDAEVEPGNAGQVKIVDPNILQAIVSNETTEIKDSSGDVIEIITPYADDFGSRPFSLRYFISYDSIYANINQAFLTTVILNVILFLVTLIAVMFLVNRSILSPLAKITKVAYAIDKGDLEQKIEVNTKDELGDLALSLNQMTTTLKNNIFELKKVDKLKDEFIAIASHNLRTPLTVIKGYISALKAKNLDKESVHYVDNIDNAAGKLSTISESLINIVLLERTTQSLTKNFEDITQIINTIVDIYKPAAEKKHVTLNVHLPKQEVKILVDRARIKQAINNIIDNAIKFNKENGQVNIELTTLDSEILLSVIDTGIGIPPEEIKDIFQRFHRATSVLTYNYEGIGLGLFLSRTIIEAHSGKIWVTSNLGEGTNVYISLPIE